MSNDVLHEVAPGAAWSSYWTVPRLAALIADRAQNEGYRDGYRRWSWQDLGPSAMDGFKIRGWAESLTCEEACRRLAGADPTSLGLLFIIAAAEIYRQDSDAERDLWRYAAKAFKHARDAFFHENNQLRKETKEAIGRAVDFYRLRDGRDAGSHGYWLTVLLQVGPSLAYWEAPHLMLDGTHRVVEALNEAQGPATTSDEFGKAWDTLRRLRQASSDARILAALGECRWFPSSSFGRERLLQAVRRSLKDNPDHKGAGSSGTPTDTRPVWIEPTWSDDEGWRFELRTYPSQIEGHEEHHRLQLFLGSTFMGYVVRTGGEWTSRIGPFRELPSSTAAWLLSADGEPLWNGSILESTVDDDERLLAFDAASGRPARLPFIGRSVVVWSAKELTVEPPGVASAHLAGLGGHWYAITGVGEVDVTLADDSTTSVLSRSANALTERSTVEAEWVRSGAPSLTGPRAVCTVAISKPSMHSVRLGGVSAKATGRDGHWAVEFTPESQRSQYRVSGIAGLGAGARIRPNASKPLPGHEGVIVQIDGTAHALASGPLPGRHAIEDLRAAQWRWLWPKLENQAKGEHEMKRGRLSNGRAVVGSISAPQASPHPLGLCLGGPLDLISRHESATIGDRDDLLSYELLGEEWARWRLAECVTSTGRLGPLRRTRDGVMTALRLVSWLDAIRHPDSLHLLDVLSGDGTVQTERAAASIDERGEIRLGRNVVAVGLRYNNELLGSAYLDRWWGALTAPRDPIALARFLRRSNAPIEERMADAALTSFLTRFPTEVVSEWTAGPLTPWCTVASRRFLVDGLPNAAWQCLITRGMDIRRTFSELMPWNPVWARDAVLSMESSSSRSIVMQWYDTRLGRRGQEATQALLHDLVPGVPVSLVRDRVRPILSDLAEGRAITGSNRELILTALARPSSERSFRALLAAHVLAPIL